MLSKALAWVSVSIEALLLGNLEGFSFLRAFEIERYIKIDVKCPVIRYVSPQGSCWGTWRGFACGNSLREKDSVSGFLSWTQRTLRF
jgi:hypothetical protein